MRPTCPLCRHPMSVAENGPVGFGGEGSRYACRSPGCISNSVGSSGATWIGGSARQSSPPAEVLGAPREDSPFMGSSWIGASSATVERSQRSAVPERSANGHEFVDGVCLQCGRMERLAGRYGWSCPVRLP